MLLADWEGYERFAHLAYVPDARRRRRDHAAPPAWRSARSRRSACSITPAPPRCAPDSPQDEEATLLRMIERGVNSPLTSSMGRLFDSVAAIVGIADDARYEGEAAILLEAAADRSAEGAYEFGLVESPASGALADDSLPLVVDPTPVLSAVLDDLAGEIPAGVISARFHRAVVGCIVRVGLRAARTRRNAATWRWREACS